MTGTLDARARTAPSGRGVSRIFYGWRIVGVLAVTETVSWGILYYAFAVFQVPMRAELGFSAAEVTGAFSVAVLATGLAAVPVGRWLDRRGARGLMTGGSVAAVLLVLAWSRVHTLLELYLVFAGIGLVSAAVLYEPAFAVMVRWSRATRTPVPTLAHTLLHGICEGNPETERRQRPLVRWLEDQLRNGDPDPGVPAQPPVRLRASA